MAKRPKIENLIELVHEHGENGTYVLLSHARQRAAERSISRHEIKAVLTEGWHEKRKDTYSEHYRSWSYAIRCKLEDEDEGRNIRIIVTFDEDDPDMLVVTVIDLDD